LAVADFLVTRLLALEHVDDEQDHQGQHEPERELRENCVIEDLPLFSGTSRSRTACKYLFFTEETRWNLTPAPVRGKVKAAFYATRNARARPRWTQKLIPCLVETASPGTQMIPFSVASTGHESRTRLGTRNSTIISCTLVVPRSGCELRHPAGGCRSTSWGGTASFANSTTWNPGADTAGACSRGRGSTLTVHAPAGPNSPLQRRCAPPC
jgi:hypothetical protein